jgi:hypothetical protein
MNRYLPSFIAFAIIIYCAWNASELLDSWWGAPYEHFSWILLLIWCFPIILFWFPGSPFHTSKPTCEPILLGLALIVSLIGVLGSLHAVEYLGFALALASLIPWSLKLIGWVISSLGWMPVLGWLGSHYFSQAVFIVRACIVILGVASALYTLKYEKSEKSRYHE